LRNLNRLRIQSRKLEKLDGIELTPDLSDVSFVGCPKLSDISAIRRLNGLRNAMFFACKQVNDLAPFDGMEMLERLHLENGIEVASVHPLSACKHLRELYLIGMKVADGDLSPLLALPKLEKVAIAKKKNHSHSMQEINAAIFKESH
ncbi:MAG: hypothetical protein AB7P23_04910, partial [Amphiplicatus sp.]